MYFWFIYLCLIQEAGSDHFTARKRRRSKTNLYDVNPQQPTVITAIISELFRSGRRLIYIALYDIRKQSNKF